MNIKDLVKYGIVRFSHYRAGVMYYDVLNDWNGQEYDTHYQFPVPLEDVGNASLFYEEKAITYMRWIRKAIDEKTIAEIV